MKIVSINYHGFEGKSVNVGNIAYTKGIAKFEYDTNFLNTKINLSPFSIELNSGLQEAKKNPFNGLHGLFSDSLPDGWGLLIQDRTLIKHGINPQTITPVDRLSYIGSRTMGALSYHPDEGAQYLSTATGQIDLNIIAEESIKIYTGEVDDVLSEIEENAISPAGARPKSLIATSVDGTKSISGVHNIPDGYEHWLAKFPPGKSADAKAECPIEFIYSKMARYAGIEFPETKLITNNQNYYFLAKRFDRGINNQRIHVHSLAGLVHANYRVPDYSYVNLLKVCQKLTQSYEEVIQLFKRMIFNIISGNRDDHTKNFSFIMTADGQWKNSPAYDITYNKGMGEHAMLIGNTGKDITLNHLIEIGKVFSITRKQVITMVELVSDSMFLWFDKSRDYSIPNMIVNEISSYINTQKNQLVELAKK